MQNRIDVSLSASPRDDVLDLISPIRTKLPFLIDLSPEERQTLPKMGDKSRAFVSGALQLATQDDQYLPRSFDVAEMRRDVELADALDPISVALRQLSEYVDDTYIQVGSEPTPPRSSSINRQNATDKARHSTACSTRSVNASPANQKKNRTNRRRHRRCFG